MMATIESGPEWCLEENMVMDEIWLKVRTGTAQFVAYNGGCDVLLPPDLIDAIRAMSPRHIPHLRQQRAAIFSERSRKGWQTRRNERKAQQDADIKTLIGMPADAPKSVTEIRVAK
jgi:hypothetical protein